MVDFLFFQKPGVQWDSKLMVRKVDPGGGMMQFGNTHHSLQGIPEVLALEILKVTVFQSHLVSLLVYGYLHAALVFHSVCRAIFPLSKQITSSRTATPSSASVCCLQ